MLFVINVIFGSETVRMPYEYFLSTVDTDGAFAPGHKYQQCWVRTHAFPADNGLITNN